MGDMFRVRTSWAGSYPGTPYLTTFYFGTGLYVVDDAVTATVNLWGAVQSLFSTLLTATVEADVALIDDATGNLVSVEHATTGDSVTGSNSDDPVPAATQGLCRISTGDVIGGRLLRGHFFMPGAVEGNNSFGVPNADYKNILQAAAQDLIDDVGCELRVWSRAHGASALAVGASSWDKWAVLRSRRD